MRRRVDYAHARPVITWAGTTPTPSSFRVGFSIAGRDDGTVRVSVDNRTRHMTVLGVWKLVYPGKPPGPGNEATDFVKAIQDSARIVVTWDGQREEIRWEYANPQP